MTSTVVKEYVEINAVGDAVKKSCTRAYAKGYADGIMHPKQPTVIADYCRLELYEHDYHFLLSRWLVEKGLAITDVEIEFYATYVSIHGKVIPYDVQFHGAESEQLVAWVE